MQVPTSVQDPAAFLARWHYLGLFAVIFAEEAGVPLPIPGDLFIAAMGFLASTGRASFVPAAAAILSAGSPVIRRDPDVTTSPECA